MSSQVLKEPIVADELGNLYNKEAVLKYLMNKKPEPQFAHIRSLKDIITLKLQTNPSLSESDKKQMVKEGEDTFYARWVCPITMADTNGKNKFVALRTCGCVLSDRALREVPSNTCLVCQKPYSPSDLLILVPAPNELAEQRARMEARRAQQPAPAKKTSDTGARLAPASTTPASAAPASSSSSSGSDSKTKRIAVPQISSDDVTKKPRVDKSTH